MNSVTLGSFAAMIMTRKQEVANILSSIVGRDFDEQMLLYPLPLMNLLWI